jgi:hypothetical protein
VCVRARMCVREREIGGRICVFKGESESMASVPCINFGYNIASWADFYQTLISPNHTWEISIELSDFTDTLHAQDGGFPRRKTYDYEPATR